MMPKMMGFDVCRALRAEGDNVPVIILTAREEEADKVSGLEIGADDYIPKPLRFFFFFLRCIARMKASSSASTAGPSGANRFIPPEWFSYSPPENDAVKRRAKEEQIPYL